MIEMQTKWQRVLNRSSKGFEKALWEVKRHRHERKFVAKVLCIGTDCDLALLDVPEDDFWKVRHVFAMFIRLYAIRFIV